MVTITGISAALIDASIAGVPFQIIDTSIEVGRRLQRFLFPGVDDARFQDLGALDGPISVRGVLIGDDYVDQAARLRAMLRAQGPLSLVHPWLGNIQVVLLAPARVTFSMREIRCARFEAQFFLWTPPGAAASNTLTGLNAAASATTDAASSFMIAALSPPGNAFAAFSIVQAWVGSIYAQFAALVQTGPSGDLIATAASGALTTLGAPTSAPSSGWQATIVQSVLDVPAAVGASATPLIPSAVAPGGLMTAAQPADPGDVAAMLIAGAAIAGASSNPTRSTSPAPLAALALGLQAASVAAAAQAAALISYVSAQDAAAEASVIFTAIDGAITAAAMLAETDPLNAAPVWQQLQDLKSAFAANMNSLIGSLPEVVMIELSNAVPAWILAHYIAGDTPSQMFATWQDILDRNATGAPAAIGPGDIEVLDNAA